MIGLTGIIKKHIKETEAEHKPTFGYGRAG